MAVAIDHIKDTTHPSAYEALFALNGTVVTSISTDPVFGQVFHVPNVASCGEITPSFSKVRIIESRTIDLSDPLAYNHKLTADGFIQALAIPGKLPVEEWDY